VNIQNLHSWDLSVAQAKDLQRELSSRVILADRFTPIQYVAGVDVAFKEAGQISRAAVVVLTFPELAIVEQTVAEVPTVFPYEPGLLSFREIPPVLAALQKLTIQPDLILCDGQGLAHPRRFGLACHLGLLLDLPTIGVAKNRYIGKHEPLGEERGAQEALIDRSEVIGTVLRTRAGTKPLYVSIGHRISLPTAVNYVLHCTPRYRLPETTRQADHLSKVPSAAEIAIEKAEAEEQATDKVQANG
jgi:deoxyribonuclease V